MTDARTALATHPFFAGVDPRLVGLVAPLARIDRWAPGSWIARTGTPATEFVLVTAGRAGVEIAPPGRAPLVVSTVHEGEVIGWSWFLPPHTWHFDVVALTEVSCVAVDAAALRAACGADHELGYEIATRLIRVMASRLEATRHQLVDVYGTPR